MYVLNNLIHLIRTNIWCSLHSFLTSTFTFYICFGTLSLFLVFSFCRNSRILLRFTWTKVWHLIGWLTQLTNVSSVLCKGIYIYSLLYTFFSCPLSVDLCWGKQRLYLASLTLIQTNQACWLSHLSHVFDLFLMFILFIIHLLQHWQVQPVFGSICHWNCHHGKI